jgi:hypothetical protein
MIPIWERSRRNNKSICDVCNYFSMSKMDKEYRIKHAVKVFISKNDPTGGVYCRCQRCFDGVGHKDDYIEITYEEYLVMKIMTS